MAVKKKTSRPTPGEDAKNGTTPGNEYQLPLSRQQLKDLPPLQLAELAARLLPVITNGAELTEKHETAAVEAAMRLYRHSLRLHDRMHREAARWEKKLEISGESLKPLFEMPKEERAYYIRKYREAADERGFLPEIEAMKLILPEETPGGKKAEKKAAAMFKRYKIYVKEQVIEDHRKKMEAFPDEYKEPLPESMLSDDNFDGWVSRPMFEIDILNFLCHYRQNKDHYDRKLRQINASKNAAKRERGKKLKADRERQRRRREEERETRRYAG